MSMNTETEPTNKDIFKMLQEVVATQAFINATIAQIGDRQELLITFIAGGKL